MGVISLCALPFTCDQSFFSNISERLPALFGIVGGFAFAQVMVFFAQKRIDASQLVPLLGLKLPMLAAMSALIGTEKFNGHKVLAILLTVFASFLLNKSGKRIPPGGFLLVLGGCFFYCVSDLCIREEVRLIQQQTGASPMLASAQTTFLSYIIIGILSAAYLGVAKSQRGGRTLAYALPFSLAWLAGIILLTVGFATLGTVNGNIIQSTRGIITVIMAPFLIRMGWTWLESKVTLTMLLRRFVAAAFMIIAVLLYNR